MSDRSPDPSRTPPGADPTRDIRLPPLPGRPAPAVPPEWSSYVPPATAGHDGAARDADRVDEPTDRLASPSDRSRQHTVSFAPPPSVQLPTVGVTPRRRRTGRVLWALVLLTLAVLVACGIYLVVTVAQR